MIAELKNRMAKYSLDWSQVLVPVRERVLFEQQPRRVLCRRRYWPTGTLHLTHMRRLTRSTTQTLPHAHLPQGSSRSSNLLHLISVLASPPYLWNSSLGAVLRAWLAGRGLASIALQFSAATPVQRSHSESFPTGWTLQLPIGFSPLKKLRHQTIALVRIPFTP